MEPLPTKEVIESAITAMSQLIGNVEVRNYDPGTMKKGKFATNNPRSEGKIIVENNNVTLTDIDLGSETITFKIKSLSGNLHTVAVKYTSDAPSLTKIIESEKGNPQTHTFDAKNPLQKISKLEFAVDTWLKKHATDMLESDACSSIPSKIVNLLSTFPTLMLTGLVGCGKTHNLNCAFNLLCEKYGKWSKFVFFGSEGASDNDLIGTFIPKENDNGFVYVPGVMVRAFRAASEGERVFLFLDEINRFSSKNQNIFIQALNLVEDKNGTAIGFCFYNHHTQEEIFAPRFDSSNPSQGGILFVSSVNIEDQGTNPMSKALKRRFACVFDIKYLPPQEEAELLQERTNLALGVCKKMVSVATSVRAAYLKMAVAAPLDTGSLINWALAVSKKPIVILPVVMESAEYTWLHKCVMYEANGVPSEESYRGLQDIVTDVFGTF